MCVWWGEGTEPTQGKSGPHKECKRQGVGEGIAIPGSVLAHTPPRCQRFQGWTLTPQQPHCMEHRLGASGTPVPKGCLGLGLLSRATCSPRPQSPARAVAARFWAIHW